MNRKLISVVIPAFNAERYLAEALDSIRCQDYQPHEVIVVDNGSTDSTAAIVKSYPEVGYVWQRNQGHGAAKNIGLSHATGELISFLDADDLWVAGRSRIGVAYLEANPEAGCVIARMRNFLQPGAAQPRWVTDDMLCDDFKAYQVGTLLAHRWVFERIGNFDPAFTWGDETDWFVRLMESGIRLGVLSDVWLSRRIHQNSKSAKHDLRSRNRLRRQ